MITLILQKTIKPWVFVRYDIGKHGIPANLRVEQSAGMKSHDEVGLVTARSWRYAAPAGGKVLRGCVSRVSID